MAVLAAVPRELPAPMQRGAQQLQPDDALQLQPLLLLGVVQCIGRFFLDQGLPELAEACDHASSSKCGARLAPTMADGADTVPEHSAAGEHVQLLRLARDLLFLTGHHAPNLSATSSAEAEGDVRFVEPLAELPRCSRLKLTLAHEGLSFLWPLLPPFIERPWGVAALASLARLPNQALHDDSQRLCVGHANLHPNSLGPNESGPTNGATTSLQRSGILEQISFSSLVSAQFHLPRLSEAFCLLETITTQPCHALRKLVDRQSRWRPREQRFEALEEPELARAAALADALGGLRSLKHLEGPTFSMLLRARAQLVAKSPGETPLVLNAWLDDVDRDGSDTAVASGPARPSSTEANVVGLGERLEIIHLMDATKEDLFGLCEPLYPKLHKLVLLNLPATSPGLTASAVAAFLPKVPNLTELQLDFAYFDPANWELSALESLIEQVQSPPSKVSKLIMEWCRLGDAGVRHVCETLSRHPNGAVTDLSMAHCEMRDVTSVCEMLETPDISLTKLDLSSNTLDDCQAGRLAKALAVSQVKELRLRDSQVSVPLPVKTEWFWGC